MEIYLEYSPEVVNCVDYIYGSGSTYNSIYTQSLWEKVIESLDLGKFVALCSTASLLYLLRKKDNKKTVCDSDVKEVTTCTNEIQTQTEPTDSDLGKVTVTKKVSNETFVGFLSQRQKTVCDPTRVTNGIPTKLPLLRSVSSEPIFKYVFENPPKPQVRIVRTNPQIIDENTHTEDVTFVLVNPYDDPITPATTPTSEILSSDVREFINSDSDIYES